MGCVRCRTPFSFVLFFPRKQYCKSQTDTFGKQLKQDCSGDRHFAKQVLAIMTSAKLIIASVSVKPTTNIIIPFISIPSFLFITFPDNPVERSF